MRLPLELLKVNVCLHFTTGGDRDDIEQVHAVRALSKLFTVLPRKDIVKGIDPVSYMFEIYDVSVFDLYRTVCMPLSPTQ